MSKATVFKEFLLQSKKITYIMEAHNGLSAKIVEQAGFPGIWASGLAISASLGHRDCNEISWTQLVDVLEFMSEATTIPILVDGDTGFGNFNNVRELVKKLCAREIAGVCLEDKIFPKTNSFIARNQELADIGEFCGKIKAAKDTQVDCDFCVIARTEAFIAGLGVEEALKRAFAYKEAGADAILVHSKKSTAEDIEDFCTEWDYSIPLVIVPTKYYRTPVKVFERLDISLVIWANHNLRACIYYMQRICRQIQEQQSSKNIEEGIASLSEIFELMNESELEEAEKKYFAMSNPQRSVLCAGLAE